MSMTHVVGVDPGLVHTGVVRMLFMPDDKHIDIEHLAVTGPDAKAVKQFIDKVSTGSKPHTFIEAYRPRSHFGSDEKMVQVVGEMKKSFSSTTVLNTGVKKVVKKPLMELLDVWKFSTVTNHQDLRSAARIALFGMLKQEPLNRLLADVVHDHLNGETWDVAHR